MTPEDIERMAREAGFPFNKYGMLQGPDEEGFDADDMLVRFAALVAAAERERCAEIIESSADACNPYSGPALILRSNAAAIRHGGK